MLRATSARVSHLVCLGALVLAFAPGCAGGGDEAPDDEVAGEADSLSATQLTVTLQSYAGNYLVADKGGGADLMAYSTWAKEWETFTLADLNGGSLNSGDIVTLKGSSGQWVSADKGGGGALTVTAPWGKGWEQFRILKASGSGKIGEGDKIALQTTVGGEYVSVIDAGGGAVAATATHLKEWETLTIHVSGKGGSGGSTPRGKVLDYFASVNAQKKAIAGQQNKFNSAPAGATDWIKSHTGKQPGLWSADFGFGSDALDNRWKMIAEAKKQWSQGAVVQIMYHNCIPTRDEYCSWDDIGGAHPQHLSNSQWSELVTDGTSLNKAWKARLDTLSPYFADLKAAGVAPLFRPLHEMNQGAFWWGGRSGAGGTRKLWQITYDYLVKTKGFDNIVWVWDIQDFGSLGSDVSSYNPGASYYDIAALDVYDGGYDAWKYDAMVNGAGGKPIAIGECEKPPTSAQLASQPKWSFFMLWPDFLDENAGTLPGLYGAPNVITEGQMPGWK
jgi:hypothetical protein